MKKSFALLMLSFGLFLGSTASADSLVADSSGAGSCQNPTWAFIGSSYDGNNNVQVNVYGLQCTQTGTNVYAVRVFVNGSCTNGGGTGFAGTTFSGNTCGTWSVTAASTCPYSGRIIYSSIPMSEMNAKMNDTQSQCKTLNFACNAAATPIAFSGSTPTYFKSYCN